MLKPNTMLRHFKGGVYQYITTATNQTDGSNVAVYGDDEGNLHVRKVSEFFDVVTNDDGEHVSRFEKVTN